MENAQGEVADLKHHVSHETQKAEGIKREINVLAKNSEQKQSYLQSIIDEVRKMNTSPPTPHCSGEDGVLGVERSLMSNYQTELESKKSDMEKMQKTLSEMHRNRARQQAALEWHNREHQLSEEDRGQRDVYVNTALAQISRMEEDCNAVTVGSSRGGSFEGSQVSLSGEKHGTYPREDRESKHRREQGENEKLVLSLQYNSCLCRLVMF